MRARSRRAAAVSLSLCLFASAAAIAGAGSEQGPNAPRRLSAPAGFVGNDAPAWSPDGTKIAFTSFRHGKGEIYVMAPDGSGQRRLTNDEGHDDLPAWSPDGRRIAFASSRSGGRDIYVMNADGSRPVRLTEDTELDFSPSWSPDGSKIAFRSNRDGNGEIYVMNADGSGEVNVTRNPFADESPRWGPDGRIAFASTRGRLGYNIYVMNADGTGVRKVTSYPGYQDERSPDWSRDGRTILFVSDREPPFGNLDIYAVDARGGELRRLTDYIGHDDWPSWSPNGLLIAFSRGPAVNVQEVHVMASDGTGVRKLTSTRTPSAPRLSVAAFSVSPKRPVAGRTFAATLVVRGLSPADAGSVGLACRARIAATALRVTDRSVSGARARCAWAVPASAKGKRLRGSVALALDGSGVARAFAFAVR